jgi:hypothetical protein
MESLCAAAILKGRLFNCTIEGINIFSSGFLHGIWSLTVLSNFSA